jgi:hypothetical protein
MINVSSFQAINYHLGTDLRQANGLHGHRKKCELGIRFACALHPNIAQARQLDVFLTERISQSAALDSLRTRRCKKF